MSHPRRVGYSTLKEHAKLTFPKPTACQDKVQMDPQCVHANTRAFDMYNFGARNVLFNMITGLSQNLEM
jgi:hypothetical protein